jgi:MFS family permease
VVRRSLLTPWFALVFLAALASELANSLLVHFPGFLLDLGANELRVGLVVGVAGVASIGVRPWIGRAMDLHSRRLMIRIGTLVVAVATVMYAFADQLGPIVLLARLLQGVGQAMTMTAFWTYIADRVPVENRTQGIALFGISGLAPMGIAPALGDMILGGRWGYRGLFLVAAGFSVLAFALAMMMQRSGVTSGASTVGFSSVLRSRELRPIWLVSLFVSLGFTTAFIFVKTYVATSHIGTVGPFFAAYASMAVAWRLAFAWVPDRVGPARMVVPGLGLYAVGLATLGVMPTTLGLVLGGMFTGLGHGISYPVILGMATVRAAPGARGTATATFTAVFDLTLFAASPLIGAVIGQFGYRFMFVGVACTVLAGVFLFRWSDRRGRMAMHPSARGEPAIAPIPHG